MHAPKRSSRPPASTRWSRNTCRIPQNPFYFQCFFDFLPFPQKPFSGNFKMQKKHQPRSLRFKTSASSARSGARTLDTLIKSFMYLRNYLEKRVKICYDVNQGNHERGGSPSNRREVKTLQSYERRVITMYITLADLIQFCLLLVALVVACYTIFKGKED